MRETDGRVVAVCGEGARRDQRAVARPWLILPTEILLWIQVMSLKVHDLIGAVL